MLIAAKSRKEITTLKRLLSSEFEMKDLGVAKKILGMKITRDRKAGLLFLSQHAYIEKVLQRFNMHDAQSISTPIAPHFKLSAEQCARSDEDIEYMSKVLYCSAVGSLMYDMVCSRPDLSYAMSIVSRYMSNPGKNTGGQFSGFSGFSEGRHIIVCSLAGQLRDLLDMLIQIMLVIWTGVDHSQVMCLLLAVVL
jgi:hypothetical protein